MEYKVKIDAFEGPLDLLLHLIKKLEIDIYDIPVAVITEQYLDFIHAMQELQLDVASEYLVMAATLIEMKSRMLLPKPEPLDADLDETAPEDEEDPREELVRRLLEYRQYKEAAEVLKEKELERRKVYAKPPSDLTAYVDKAPDPPLANVSIYDMLAAFRHLLRRKQLEKPLNTKVQKQEVPIGPRMEAIVKRLKVSRKPLAFSALFTYPNRTHLVVTFLALLELMKERRIMCVQDRNFSEIMVYLLDEGGVLS
ncbi:segregation/condensation protein A [Caenibacillus caldisaponilyticus]|uniref:segregation/condensation protein A n=1 Tax=Caenibacillus caldisaponilyticus TaxID=1674942 RepID=UPI0009884E90|nr:segregation/condensation protein A [Caenibacillus caldisaponilyticus]